MAEVMEKVWDWTLTTETEAQATVLWRGTNGRFGVNGAPAPLPADAAWNSDTAPVLLGSPPTARGLIWRLNTVKYRCMTALYQHNLLSISVSKALDDSQ